MHKVSKRTCNSCGKVYDPEQITHIAGSRNCYERPYRAPKNSPPIPDSWIRKHAVSQLPKPKPPKKKVVPLRKTSLSLGKTCQTCGRIFDDVCDFNGHPRPE